MSSGIDLVNIISPPAWMADAACAEIGGDEWFPEKGGSPAAAKRVCAGCAVRAECLAYALEHDERFGVWGGASERDRRRITQRADHQVRAVPEPEPAPSLIEEMAQLGDARRVVTGATERSTSKPRIAEVRRLSAAGLTDRQIADRLGCSTRTVERDRAALRRWAS